MATTTNSGQNYEIRNITLNATTDTPVDFNQQVNSVLLKCRTAIDMQVRRSSNDNNYFTVSAGSSLTLDVAMTDQSEGGYIVAWVKAASGTPVLEALGTF